MTKREQIKAALDGLIKDTVEFAQFDLLTQDEPVADRQAVAEMVENVPEMVNDDAAHWLDEIMQVIEEV